MLYYFYCEKYSVLELLLLWVKISSFSLTFGVNMWAMPSTAPLSIKPRTRKQNSTTYGKRELKYITWVRASPVRYTVLPWIRSSVALQSHSVSLAHTHTHGEWIPKLLCVCLAQNLWNPTKCGESTTWGLERWVKNPSYSISGNHFSTMIIGLLNLVCRKPWQSMYFPIEIVGWMLRCGIWLTLWIKITGCCCSCCQTEHFPSASWTGLCLVQFKLINVACACIP